MPTVPDLSIVIPTFRRVDALCRTLDALAGQRLDDHRVEIIVVDNNSGDNTVATVQALAAGYPHDLQIVVERGRGPAAARNAGIPLATAPLIMFLGDDTPPAHDDFLAGHLDAHRAGDAQLAVVGRSTWHPSLQVTPVMEWLERSGIYFNYELMEHGALGPAVFYTNNISLRREAVVSVDGFDERFPDAACEDYDLGLRLADKGLRLVFDPALVVFHEHQYDLETSLRRMWTVGKAANIVRRIHVGRAVDTPHPPAWKVAVAKVVAPVLTAVPVPEARLRVPVRDRVYKVIHRASLARGYRAGAAVPVDARLRGGLRRPSPS